MPRPAPHGLGLQARRATEHARSQVAGWLGGSPKSVVFTSGATEANNLAILGVVRARHGPRHVITVATEHPAVLDPVAALAREGVDVTVLPVNGQGLVDPDAVVAALRPSTVLVSVMRVNNEIGVIQPLAEIAQACRERGVLVHTDAAQASLVPTDLDTLGVDLISVSGHKIYGPKGVGALMVRRTRPRIEIEPLMYGGGHERGLRSGTLPVPLIVGLGEAATRIAAGLSHGEPERIRALRDRLWAGLQREVPDVQMNGPVKARTAQNLNVRIPGQPAQALLIEVRHALAASTGSACASESAQPSHVLAALGLGADAMRTSIRFGVGRFTTSDEIDRAIAAIASAIR